MAGYNHMVLVVLNRQLIWGDISRVRPLTVDYAVYTQALTEKTC